MNFLKPISVLLLAIMFSCAAVQNPVSAKIVRDCSGTYLRISGKDYQVCNSEMIKNFANNSVINVTYEKAENCPEFQGQIVCMLYHENEGIIRIKSVK